jgi:hypothetical protein
VHEHDVPYDWLTEIGRLDGNTDKLNVDPTKRVTTVVDIAWNNTDRDIRKDSAIHCALCSDEDGE